LDNIPPVPWAIRMRLKMVKTQWLVASEGSIAWKQLGGKIYVVAYVEPEAGPVKVAQSNTTPKDIETLYDAMAMYEEDEHGALSIPFHDRSLGWPRS
jgi:hypothetical protein